MEGLIFGILRYFLRMLKPFVIHVVKTFVFEFMIIIKDRSEII